MSGFKRHPARPPFLIRPHAGGWQWLQQPNPQGATKVMEGSAAELALAASGKDMVLLLPGSSLYLDQAKVPGRNRKLRRQALPYALEDQLAQEPDELHFISAESAGDEQLNVGVMDDSLLQQWLAELAAAELYPAQAIPDFLAIPADGNGLGLLWRDDEILFRNGPDSGCVLDPSWAPWALQQLTRPEQQPLPLLVAADANDTRQEGLSPPLVEISRSETPFLALCQQSLACRELPPYPNFIQGLSSHYPAGGGNWRLPAWLAAAAVFLALAGQVTQNWQLKRQNHQLNELIETTFRQAFPQVQRLVNPLVQAQQEVDRQGGLQGAAQAEFLRLLNGVAPELLRTQAQISSLRYNGQRLELELEAQSIEQMERIAQAAEQAGLTAELGSASPGENGTTGLLSLRSRGI